MTYHLAMADQMGDIKTTIQFYKDSKSVSSQVQKKVFFSLLDETKESQGIFLFSKNKLRLEMKEPEVSLIVLSPKMVWVVNEIMINEKKKTQVLKIQSTKGHFAKAPLAMLLSEPKTWDQFKVVNSDKKDGLDFTRLVPKKDGQFGDLTEVEIAIDKKKKIIQTLSYKDEVENKTEFKFTNVQFKTAIHSDQFKYNPPANAEVTEY